MTEYRVTVEVSETGRLLVVRTYRGNEFKKNKNNEIETIQQQLSFRFFFSNLCFGIRLFWVKQANDAHNLYSLVSLNQRIKNHCYPWDFGGALSREDNSRWVVDHNDLEAVKTRKEFCFFFFVFC